jgi:hypothetical protein
LVFICVPLLHLQLGYIKIVLQAYDQSE